MGSGISKKSAFVFAGLAIWLLVLALVRPLSVDESQYVAATALTAKGLLPYRDFAYLQTPLQPFVFAPLQWLFSGHLLLAMRVANALLSLVTIALVHGASRRIGASEKAALASAAMLASCQSFIWCAGVARNDVLPAALMSAGLMSLAKPGSARMLFAGLVSGLAASAKISYAVPAATVLVAMAWTDRRQAVGFAAGVAFGLIPTLFLAAIAPSAFLAEAIVFPATAPAQYYAEIGKAWRLGPARFIQLLEAAAIGPALIAAIEVGRRNWWDDPVRRTMLAAALGGLISAALNKPFQIFYLLPALPPLFVLAGLALSEVRPRWLTGAWAVFLIAGLFPPATWLVRASSGLPVVDAQRRSAALGKALIQQHVDGPVATFAGQYVANVDPRFAAGPFLYRTHGFLSDVEARDWHIVTQGQALSLAERPPAAIVAGSYPDAQPDLEAALAKQAKALGYSPKANAGGFTIWKR